MCAFLPRSMGTLYRDYVLGAFLSLAQLYCALDIPALSSVTDVLDNINVLLHVGINLSELTTQTQDL